MIKETNNMKLNNFGKQYKSFFESAEKGKSNNKEAEKKNETTILAKA